MKAKKVKKEWYTLTLPEIFGAKELALVPASNPQQLLGRRIVLSALDVLEDPGKYYLKIFFKIKEVENHRAKLEFEGLECLRDYISRIVVRRTTRVDVDQNIQTKNGKRFRILSLAVLPSRPSKKVRGEIRKKIVELLKVCEKFSLDEFVTQLVLKNGLKNKIAKELSKIHPLRKFEIQKVKPL